MSDGAESEACDDRGPDAGIEDLQCNMEYDESRSGDGTNSGIMTSESSSSPTPVLREEHSRVAPQSNVPDNSSGQSQPRDIPSSNVQTFQVHGIPAVLHGGINVVQHPGNLPGMFPPGIFWNLDLDPASFAMPTGFALDLPMSDWSDSDDLFTVESRNIIGNLDPLLQAMQASFNLSQGHKPQASARALEFVPAFRLEKDETIECPICADVLRDGEWASRMPCGHYFSHEELEKWLAVNNTCPVCRFELPSIDEEYNRSKRLSYKDLRSSFEVICKTPNDIFATRIENARRLFQDGVLAVALDEMCREGGHVHSWVKEGVEESESCCKCCHVHADELEEELQQLADQFLKEQMLTRRRMEILLDLD